MFLFNKLHAKNVNTGLQCTYSILCESSTIESNTAGYLSSDSLFMSSITFAFTAYTDSNLVPFFCSNLDLIFAKKNNHMGLGLVSMVNDGASSEMLCATMLSWWRIHELFFHISGWILVTCSSHEELSKPPCSSLVNCLSSNTQFTHNSLWY